MRRTRRILTLTLALILLVSPALAFYDVVQDHLNAETGIGIAIIHVSGNTYATVWYVDTNGDGMYSEGDLRLRAIPFRRG